MAHTFDLLARQRPRVPLRRRRLAARREATCVRSLGVERRQHEHARQGARALHAEDVPRERAARDEYVAMGEQLMVSEIATDSYIVAAIEDHIVPLARVVPHDAALQRARALRPDVGGPHRRHRQPAEPEGATLDQCRPAVRSGTLDRRRDRASRHLVERLGRLDRRTRVERCGYRPRWATPRTLCSVTRPARMSEAEQSAGAHRVRVGSFSLHCSVTGSEGRPLLLVSGLGANVEMWTPFRRSLGSRHTIAFDAPGTGQSTTPLRPLTMRELGTVAFGVLDALGYDEVDVLGYSFGGAIAQEMARAQPARIHRLVLAATSCGWGSVPGDPLAMLAMATPARYYFGPVMANVNALFGANTLSDFATVDAARLHHPPDPLGYCWQLLAALGWSSLPWLHRVDVPPWCWPRAATGWCASTGGAPGSSDPQCRASKSYPARTTFFCSAKTHVPRRSWSRPSSTSGPRISPTRRLPARSCGRHRATLASGRR